MSGPVPGVTYCPPFNHMSYEPGKKEPTMEYIGIDLAQKCSEV
jgi:hypothetical protein